MLNTMKNIAMVNTDDGSGDGCNSVSAAEGILLVTEHYNGIELAMIMPHRHIHRPLSGEHGSSL